MSEKNRNCPSPRRMKILRTRMPEQDPEIRSRNFEEVNLGLAAGRAAGSHALHCLRQGRLRWSECPVGVKIARW